MPRTETMVVRRGKQDLPIQIPSRFKNQFDKKHGEGSLQKLFEQFAADRETLKTIGHAFQLSESWARQLYRRFFCQTAGYLSGNARKKHCSLARRIQSLNPTDAMRWLWQEAPKNNCQITCTLTRWREVSKTKVLINGQQCQIRFLRNTQIYKNKSAAYAVTSLRGGSMQSTDFQIFIVSLADAPTKCFIVPTDVLTGTYKFRDDTKILIHLPIKKLPNRLTGYIDWWAYENAWHLLGGQRPALVHHNEQRTFTIPPDANISDRVVINQRTHLLNGKKCAIRQLSSIFRSNKSVRADYMRTNIYRSALLATDFQIFVLHQDDDREKHFIVPSSVLLQSYKLETDAPRGIYIPRLPREQIRKYQKSVGSIDWWQYENAWHLLEQRS